MVVDNGLIIYQKETSTKTNEIPVMQSMLKHMDIENAVITADAMHCQKETTALIREGKGDYVLQVKKSQGKLLAEIEAYFHKCYRDTPELLKQNHFTELDGEHGRINERLYRLLRNCPKITSVFTYCKVVQYKPSPPAFSETS